MPIQWQQKMASFLHETAYSNGFVPTSGFGQKACGNRQNPLKETLLSAALARSLSCQLACCPSRVIA